MTGHESNNKTTERKISSYWWPGMDTEINIHIKSCDKCQRKRKEKEAALHLHYRYPNALSQIKEFIWTYSGHSKKVHDMHIRCLFEISRAGCNSRQKCPDSSFNIILKMVVQIWLHTTAQNCGHPIEVNGYKEKTQQMYKQKYEIQLRTIAAYLKT
jgi:hypothetical protein